MNLLQRLLLLACIPAVLSACGGSGAASSGVSAPPAASAPTPPTVTAPLSSGPVIDNEDLGAGLRGTDGNANGIRDDVDRLIAQRYSTTPALKRAAEQSARALQKFMQATTKQQVLVAGDDIMRAGACVDKALPENTPQNSKLISQFSKDLLALIANTRERFTAYWAANKLAGGAVFDEPREPVCD